MQIKIKKLYNLAKVPAYAHTGDAGMDLFSTEEFSLKSFENHAFQTGISIEIPLGYVGLIMEKSGLALKNKIMVMGGVIDSGFRGEIKVIIYNASKEEYKFQIGDKLAQLVIEKVEAPEIIEVKELSDTSRNENGFGSTGK